MGSFVFLRSYSLTGTFRPRTIKGNYRFPCFQSLNQKMDDQSSLGSGILARDPVNVQCPSPRSQADDVGPSLYSQTVDAAWYKDPAEGSSSDVNANYPVHFQKLLPHIPLTLGGPRQLFVLAPVLNRKISPYIIDASLTVPIPPQCRPDDIHPNQIFLRQRRTDFNLHLSPTLLFGPIGG